MLKEVKQCEGDILLYRICQVSRPLKHDEINCAVTKNGHPHQREPGRNKEYAGDKLTYRSATRNTGNKHANEGRP